MAIPFGTSIGAGIGPEQLNDDLLGRTQGSLYAYDVTAPALPGDRLTQ
ncbi:MAG: hypothetical protein V2J55_19075 [Candidatus Competibacteraceae bacterium]|jgi:hypothetical protein|nr:hypothetical protein [Candidatus Competibacteraceae bacterium]